MKKTTRWQNLLTVSQKKHAKEWLVPNEGLFNRALVLERAKESKANGCLDCIHIVAKLEDGR